MVILHLHPCGLFHSCLQKKMYMVLISLYILSVLPDSFPLSYHHNYFAEYKS